MNAHAITTEEKQGTNGSINGTHLACTCGWHTSTSLPTQVSTLSYEHLKWAERRG